MGIRSLLPLATLVALLVPAAVAHAGESASRVVIHEFRFGGPGGTTDEYYELLNTGNIGQQLNGWVLQPCSNGPGSAFTALPNVRLLPGESFLVAGPGYTGSVAADATNSWFVPEDTGGGVLLRTGPSGSIVDQVGTAANTTCKEGGGLGAARTAAAPEPGTSQAPPSTTTTQDAFVRRTSKGVSVDTGHNEDDFIYVSPDAATNALTGDTQGQINPEHFDATTPVRGNVCLNGGQPFACQGPGGIGVALLDTGKAENQKPNRDRKTTTGSAPMDQGDLYIRRKFTNHMQITVSQLFLQVDLDSTFGSWFDGITSGAADLRPVASDETSVAKPGGGTYTVVPATVVFTGTANPPGAFFDPTQGGGQNTLLQVTLPSPLAQNDSVNVSIKLAVHATGSYKLALTPLFQAPLPAFPP